MREHLVSLESQLNNDQPTAQVKHALASCRVTEDDRNGWIQVAWPEGPVETVVKWTSATGDRVFGHVVDAPGDPESVEPLTFWSYSKGIDLRDFWDDSKSPPDERFHPVALRYLLPRRGTNIQAILDGPYDVETAFYLSKDRTRPDLEAHVAAVRTAKYKKLELLWDRQAARFSKGKREPQARTSGRTKSHGKISSRQSRTFSVVIARCIGGGFCEAQGNASRPSECQSEGRSELAGRVELLRHRHSARLASFVDHA